MTKKTVIKIENLSKRYILREQEQRSATNIQGKAWNFVRSTFDYLLSTLTEPDERKIMWALRNISFEVTEGEIVGIIGHNGAGKSTLLKILSRITRPTEGSIELIGRFSALVEVGTGFHPDLTGRENVYLNGAILGMNKSEIDEQFDNIVEFAGVEKYIDTPVKFYSSGMFVRLGFAVAAHLQPDIMIVDEVLSVGDAGFQKKSIKRIEQAAQQGRTVLFVSHNMAIIENMCQRVIVLDNGEMVFDGDTREGIAKYISQTIPSEETNLLTTTDRFGTGDIIITSFEVQDKAKQKLDYIPSGHSVSFVIGYSVNTNHALDDVVPSFAIKNAYGTPLILHRSSFTAQYFDNITGTGEFRCEIPKLPLAAGQYVIDCNLEVNGEVADDLTVAEISIIEGDFFRTGSKGLPAHSPILIDGKWINQSSVTISGEMS